MWKSKKMKGKIHLNIEQKHSKVTFKLQKPDSFANVYLWWSQRLELILEKTF